MSVGTKLFVWLIGPMILLLGLLGYIEGINSSQRLRQELAREGRAISRIVQLAFEDALRDRQIGDIHELVDQISGYERILGVRLFDRNGDISYQGEALAPYTFSRADDLERVLATRTPIEYRRRYGDEPAVVFLRPLVGPDGALLGAVQVIQLESYIEEDLRASWIFIMVLTGAMILAIAAVLSLVTRIVVGRPIQTLVRGFREIGAGHPPRPIGLSSRDEFGHLSTEFGRMVTQLDAARDSLDAEQRQRAEMENELRKTARLASLGQLAAGIAHEIGTPLNVIVGRVELLERRLAGQTGVGENLRVVIQQIDRISRIVRRMLDFARAREIRLTTMDLPGVVHRAVELVDHRLRQQGVRVVQKYPGDLPAIVGDSEQLHEVFLNLALNASDAMPNGGVLTFSARRVQRPVPETGEPRDLVCVSVEDSGAGIPPDLLDRIFDPFFTTKDVGKGTGLGLSVSYGIVEDHQGWMEVESEPDLGTKMHVFLPVDGPSRRQASAA